MNKMDAAAAGQVTSDAAEIYESKFVPALFGQFAPPLLEEAIIRKGDNVLDVATGTGIVARAAIEKCASVTGVDVNEGMLAVSRRLAPDAEFVAATAEQLPFPDRRFDATLCQFGLMFFSDRVKALAEMARVTKPGGCVAIAVFDRWERSPGYCDLIPLIEEVIGPEAADALKAPFCLGNPDDLQAVFKQAGMPAIRITEHVGTVKQPSLDDWLDTEIGGWTLASMVNDQQLQRLKERAHNMLSKYTLEDGRIQFAAPAHFAIYHVG